ncbi:MAG: hypothetical protein KBA26_03425, partial [Candidatus Delongbacteria bacterium]|nr:hypothetical protein [Candidatus Delongbacteria bacterium]
YFLFLNQTYEKALEEYQKAIDLTDDGLMDTLQKGLECVQLGKLQSHQMEWKLFPIARPDTPMIHSLKKLL